MSSDAALIEQSDVTVASSTLLNPLTLTEGAWVDVLTVAVPAGTWVAWASASVVAQVALQEIALRVTDGTSEFGSQLTAPPSSAGLSVVSEPIVLPAGGTVHIQAFSQTGVSPPALVLSAFEAAKATRLFVLRVAA